MSMPSLKKLIDAAVTIYVAIRKSKETSLLHNIFTVTASAIHYQQDSSLDKKSSLEQLAALQPTGTTAEQNIVYANDIIKLMQHAHINEGSNFKCVVQILAYCTGLS